MKRLFAALAVGGVLAAAVLVSGSGPPAEGVAGDFQFKEEAVNPVTHTRFNNKNSTFRFALVADRTGGPRPGVFEKAIDQLNLMQPEFVLCVGDLISSGFPAGPERIDREWQQMRRWTAKLEMPFFYLPGNHDIRDALTARRWQEQFGRAYYHFLYKKTLFLLLNTEEPGNPGKFSDAQLAYAKQALQDNKDVRWTFVLLHKPWWASSDVAETGWLNVEKELRGRKYTVLAGHLHTYDLTLRNGMKHIVLGTTGGASELRGPSFGELVHITWITMKDGGPVIVNYALSGILPENLRKSAD